MKSKINIINKNCDGLYSFMHQSKEYGYFRSIKSAENAAIENAAIEMKNNHFKFPIIISFGFPDDKKFITTTWV